MKKNVKKLKDVCKGDILYKLNKQYIHEGISEVTVDSVEFQDNGEMTIHASYPNGDTTGLYIPKSSKTKTVFSKYDGSYFGTSREEVLKATEKYIKKSLENVDTTISDTKNKLNRLIENREKIYKLFLDVSLEVMNNKDK
jgi:hypothetical protein